MKTGKTLVELASEIERQRNAMRDFIAPTDKVGFAVREAGHAMTIGDAATVGINDLAHQQIGAHTGIPKAYYDKMRAEAPQLLADNVSEWFRKYPAPRMIRTLDDNARAFLSDRYRTLGNHDLAEAVLPTLLERNLEIVSAEITEKRLYIKAVDPSINRDIPVKGKRMGDGSHVIFDTCVPALIVSNSEVGYGTLSIESGVWTKACTNLAVFKSEAMRKYHIGGKHELGGEEVFRMLTNATRKATDRAVFMQVRDVVKAAFDEARFSVRIAKMAETTEQKIEGDPLKVVEVTAKRFGLSQERGTSILRHLIEGGDLTRYGLFNAVTRTAQDVQSYDEATEIEGFGGQIIDLPQAEWKTLAMAA